MVQQAANVDRAGKNPDSSSTAVCHIVATSKLLWLEEEGLSTAGTLFTTPQQPRENTIVMVGVLALWIRRPDNFIASLVVRQANGAGAFNGSCGRSLA